MAFSLTVHASLVAICLRAPGLHHQSEAARLLATDKLAMAAATGMNPRFNAETQILFASAAIGPQPRVVPPPDPDDHVESIGGLCYGKYFWSHRELRLGGGTVGVFVPPVGSTTKPPATAEEVWSARVNALPSNATALITAAGGTFDFTGTRDDLLELYTLAQNQAAEPAAYLAALEALFGE